MPIGSSRPSGFIILAALVAMIAAAALAGAAEEPLAVEQGEGDLLPLVSDISDLEPAPAPQAVAREEAPAKEPEPDSLPPTPGGARSVVKQKPPERADQAADSAEMPQEAPEPAPTEFDEPANLQSDIAELAGPAVPDPPARPPGAVPFEPASLNGIVPGKSNLAQVAQTWGEPGETLSDGGETVLVYEVKPFKLIEMRVVDDLVQSITVHLVRPVAAEQLAAQLKLDKIRTVEIVDAEGTSLGRAFPERGVLFSYAPDTDQQAAFILLEPLEPHAFVLRAESKLHGPYTENLQDLEIALKLAPSLSRTHWLLAETRLAVGHVRQAAEAVQSALKLEPDNTAYRLTWAACLVRQARNQEAIAEIESLLEAKDLPPLVRARALCQLGATVSTSAARDYRTAVGFQTEAIKLADSLSNDPQAEVRRAAKEVLVDAHLNVARDIAWGNWKRKAEVVPKWIERAASVAEELTTGGDADELLYLTLAQRALEAYSGFVPSIDPAKLLDEAQTSADAVMVQSSDPLAKARCQWHLGEAYSHALRIQHAAGKVEAGLKYGQLAQQNLEAGAAQRESDELARYAVWRLYFSIGALHAVHKEDHESAVAWYGKAAPLLPRLADRETTDPRHLGEALVSMGVSYWNIDLRQKGVELTQQGAKLIERAVQAGTADRLALAVPYGNLATMHQELGNEQKAQGFVQLAQGIKESGPR